MQRAVLVDRARPAGRDEQRGLGERADGRSAYARAGGEVAAQDGGVERHTVEDDGRAAGGVPGVELVNVRVSVWGAAPALSPRAGPDAGHAGATALSSFLSDSVVVVTGSRVTVRSTYWTTCVPGT